MFPNKLELDVLYAERLREAEHYRMLRKLGNPSLFERIRARLSSLAVSQPEKQAFVHVHQTSCPDVAVTSK